MYLGDLLCVYEVELAKDSFESKVTVEGHIFGMVPKKYDKEH